MIKIISFLFLLTSCVSPKLVSDNSFSIIHKSAIGGSENPGHLLIQNNETYIQFIESLKLDESEYANFLKVDFKNKNVLVLYQGQKNTGGYAIDIESVSNNDTTIVVKKREIGPKKGEITTTVITTPYCIALIPKGNKLIIE
jgi:hypothetical protein